MDKNNKNEKAGATTPANSSKVGESQEQGQLNLGSESSAAEIEKLKTELAEKDAEIETLKQAHEQFKEKLKPEIEKMKEENKALKDEIEKLKTELVKGGSSTNVSLNPDAKFVVISPFRDSKDESVIYDLGADVSNFDAARLKSLIKNGLVKENE